MKKFLSLVMALAMTLTLVTVGASAKDFTDKSSISYKEAVDVISSLKVVDGYTNGSFNPTATLTRGAAAKIICNMILGPTTASALGATSAPFKDVPVSNVFSGYIAYCSQAGIINGYSDGTFKPAATVTGYQFMKMLLGALGYDGSIEGFTGTNWTVNVAKLAISIGLNDGNDNFVGSKAMTREEAALYAFNTLTADEVKYDNKGTTITINGVAIATGATGASKVTNSVADTTKTYDGNADGYTQFCEEHFSKLKMVDTNVTDSFGRPSHTWNIVDNGKTTEVGTYSKTATYSFVITKAAAAAGSAANVAPMIKDKAGNTKLAGLTTDTVYKLNGATVTAANAALAIGDQVEVFVSSSNSNVVTCVAIERYATYKVMMNPNSNVSASDKDDGTAYYTSLAGQTKDNDIPGFDASTYVKDAVIAVAKNANTGAIADSYLATSVQGSITSYTGSDISSATAITLGGTKYTTSGSIANNIAMVSFSNGVYKLYLDKNGYVLQADTVTGTAAITDVYYVVTTYATADTTYGTTNYNVFAQRVALDGTISNIQIGTLLKGSPVGAADATKDYDTSSSNHFTTAGAAKFYTVTDGTVAQVTTSTAYDSAKSYYTLDTTAKASLLTGLYTFASVSGKSYSQPTAYTTNSAYTITTPANADLKTTSTKFGSSYLSSSTQFILTYGTKSDLKATTYSGSIALDSSKMTSGNIVISTKDSNGNLTAAYVIIPTTDKSLAVSSADLLYAYSTTYSFVSNSEKIVSMYDMTGAKVDVKIGSSDSVVKGNFYTYSVDTDGVYSLTNDTDTFDFSSSSFKSGFEKNVGFDSLYGTLLTASNPAEDFSFSDLQASSAQVIDLRSDDDKAADLYRGTINTIDTLQAVKDIDGIVLFDAYVTADGVQLIFVKDVLSNADASLAATFTGGTVATTTVTTTTSINVKAILEAAPIGSTVYYSTSAITGATPAGLSGKQVTPSTIGTFANGSYVVVVAADGTHYTNYTVSAS